MTTEHVSVPREFVNELEKLAARWTDKMFGRETQWGDGNDCAREQCARELRHILSRATPSDNARIGGVDSGEHVECLCVKCASHYGSETTATHYLPSAPRVVTDEVIQSLRECSEEHRKVANHYNKGGYLMQHDVVKKHVTFYLAIDKALESFATSLPAARVTEVYVCSNPKCRAVYAKDPTGHCPTCIQPNGVGFSTMRTDVL